MIKNLFSFMLCFIIAGIISIVFVENVKAANTNDVIITEFMANPDGVDGDREWIEIKNLSDNAIDLSDWSVDDGSNHPISGEYPLAAGEVAIICRNNDIIANDGLECNYTASIVLGNTSDTILLKDNVGTVINSVSYESGDIEEGYARFLGIVGWDNDIIHKYGQDDNYGTPRVSDVLEPFFGNEGESIGLLNGDVLLTIADVDVLTNKNSASVSFVLNAESNVILEYGEDDSYGFSIDENLVKGDNVVTISDLSCNVTYHYKLSAFFSDEMHETEDATFYMDCSAIEVNNISNIKTQARANNSFDDGWEWIFDLTVWDDNNLQMKFDKWNFEGNEINSGDNIRFSVDDGINWIAIAADDVYSELVSISDNDELTDGIQVNLRVQMKVPVGIEMGAYETNYGIKSS